MLIVRLLLAERLFDIVMETRLAENSSFAPAPGGMSTHSVAFVFTDVHGKLNCGCRKEDAGYPRLILSC